MGDLSDVFRLIKSRNRKSGFLAFSVEECEGDGYFLEKTGRYSHSKKYIQALIDQHGYELRHYERQFLRKEGSQSIIGGVYLLVF